MARNAREFCNDVHEKLATLDGRVQALKSNLGSTWQHLQEKLEEVRARGEDRRPAIDQLRNKLEQWFADKKSEDTNAIGQFKENRDSKNLGQRAQRAEDHAAYAIQVAEASFDEAERMILEAISARLQAEAV